MAKRTQPARKDHDRAYTFRLPDTLLTRVQIVAAEKHMKVPEVVRALLALFAECRYDLGERIGLYLDAGGGMLTVTNRPTGI
jgi:hypothetical protein